MIRISVPGISSQHTTKDLAVNILSYRYPLTKMQIYNEVKKRSGVTFQALNKAVNQLEESRLIEKTGRKYRLDYNWVHSLKKFSENMISRLQDEKGCLIHGIRDIREEGNVTTLTFDNLADMDKYCKSLHEHYYSRMENDGKVCMVYSHHWWHILYPEQEYSSEVTNRRFYCIGTRNTQLDRAGMRFKRKMGMNIAYNPRMPFQNIAVYGDTIVEAITSIELSNAMDDFFRRTRAAKDLDIIRFRNVLRKKGKVIVVVNKNWGMAEEIRKAILKSFKVKG